MALIPVLLNNVLTGALIGVLPVSPSVDLNLKGSSLPTGITFSRASVATDVINGTLTSFSSDQPRISSANGLLIEPARTNLALYNSSQINATMGSFTKDYTDPLGNANGAYTCVEKTGVGASQISCGTNTISYTSGTVYTASAFFKAGTCDRVQMFINSGVAGVLNYANYYLSGSGSVSVLGSGSTAAGITALSGGWYRVWLTFTATGTTTGSVLWQSLIDGTEVRSANTLNLTGRNWYYYGPQVEVGAGMSSYIPTTTATVPRAADVATYSASWINSTEGTLYAKGVPLNRDTTVSPSPHLVGLSDVANNNFHDIRRAASTGLSTGGTGTGGVQQALINGSAWTVETAGKLAYSWKNNDMSLSFNGEAIVSDTASPGGMPTGITLMGIGNHPASSTGLWNGYIHEVKCYTNKLTDTQLQQLTTL